jgi:mRNA-degrading endonuclease toxin of MazEF toxin-antitoxin module
MYTQGDIVWVKYPLADNVGFSKRPALIISNNKFNRTDVIVAKISSNIRLVKGVSYLLKDAFFEHPPLPLESEVITNSIITIDQKFITGKHTSLKRENLIEALSMVKSHFEVNV